MNVPEMTAGSWAFMAVCWVLLIALNAYCFWVMLRGKGRE